MARLVEIVPIGLGRVERWWKHWGADNREKITVETVQDAEPILKANRRAFNDAPPRFGPGMHRVASIPATVIEEICRTRGISLRELMDRRSERARSIWNEMLNDRAFRAFRTRPGRVFLSRRD